ncbi:hypothetical protein [Streptomyces lydicus]|uniref:hypothetical protein n=1 Tax=Streptomyces lydicus TaxID=47763 RepID=UPI000526F8E9|nr:hypothetical protein [Streptomyces lydicus]MDC7341035.1 hypothetical protein [Streptomyces lydicus]UEG89283.1 hypothetical protein LJ741_01250 [Streptomyces lydicus]
MEGIRHELTTGAVGPPLRDVRRAARGQGRRRVRRRRRLARVLTGERLGTPADDVFGPEGWRESGPGQWFRLLLDVAFDKPLDERVIGLSPFEPGSSSP